MEIREGTEPDLPGILAIHNDAILNTTAIWTFDTVDLANRRAVLAERKAKGYPFLVAAEGDAVLGYASFGDFRPFAGYFRTVEHSVYVDRNHRRRGIAKHLLAALIGRARDLGKHVIIGGIDAANSPSIRLHEDFGFTLAGRLPEVGFKFDRYLDLLLMQKILDPE